MIASRFAAVALLFCLPASAETGSGAAGLPRMEPVAAERLLSEVVNAVVMAQNCPSFGVSAGEWRVLTGTGDALAGSLGLEIAEYDRRYWRPAFATLDTPDGCTREGPKVRPLVARLVAMGAT